MVDEWDTGEVPRTDIADPAQKVPAPEKQRLLVLSGPDQGKQLLLERGTYLVGGRFPVLAVLQRGPRRQFGAGQFGMSSAASFVMLLLVLLVSAVQFRLLRPRA